MAARFEEEHGRFAGAADSAALVALKGEGCGVAGVAPSVLPDEQLVAYASAMGEMPAICAVVGGVLANEVIKAVGRRGAPAVDNFFLYSLAEGGVGAVERMG